MAYNHSIHFHKTIKNQDQQSKIVHKKSLHTHTLVN